MNRTTKDLLGLILLCGVLFFTNLGVPGLWDEDEPRNATCAREMWERADWIVPTFNGQLRTAKPVFLYWLIEIAYALFGVNEFAARFWSAVLGSGTVLMTYGLGRQFYSRRVGFWSGLLLACALMFGVASRACTPDACLIFFVTATLALAGACFARAESLAELRRSRQMGWLISMAVAIGCGILAKGPVAIVLPGMIVFAFLYAKQYLDQADGAKFLRMTHIGRWLIHRRTHTDVWGVFAPFMMAGIILTIALPWYVAVAYQTQGAWLSSFLGAENVGRFLKPLEGHRGPIVYYIPAVLIGFFPGSAFLPYAMWQVVQRLRSRVQSADLYLVCWAGIWIGFFSCAGTKLPSYVTPAYPALAILTARTLVEWIENSATIPRWLTQLACLTPALVGIGFLVAIPWVAHQYLPGELHLAEVGLIPLICGLGAWWGVHRRRQELFARWFAAGSVLFSVTLMGFVSVRVDHHQSSESLIRLIKTERPESFQLGTFRFCPPSLVYYAGHPLTEMKSPSQVHDFLKGPPLPRYLILRETDLAAIRDLLPVDYQVLGSRKRFLKSENLLVIGPVPTRLSDRMLTAE